MIKSKVDESQKLNTYDRYTLLIGEIIEGEVQLVRNNGVILIDDQGTEMFLSKEDMILDEYFRKGDRVRSILESVVIDKGNLKISLSRVEDLFLTKLIELEVKQVSDGLIDIIDVVRFPGIKAKVLVESYDDRIDPVGLIVGSGGSRIKGINRELRGEQIDIISNTNNLQLLVRRLFSGTEIEKVEIDDTVRIFVNQDYIGRIMGKYNSNLELASEILDKQIEVYSIK
jgi:N utilization substance protein A